jgi:hypothetical protein
MVAGVRSERLAAPGGAPDAALQAAINQTSEAAK